MNNIKEKIGQIRERYEATNAQGSSELSPERIEKTVAGLRVLLNQTNAKWQQEGSTIEAHELGIDAIKSAVEAQDLRDFFNHSYSESDVNRTYLQSGAKFKHPHEWRDQASKKFDYDKNKFNDFEFRTIEDSAARNMALTHRTEAMQAPPSQKKTLAAKHKAEEALFDLHSKRFVLISMQT